MTFKTSCEILPIGAPETATGRDLVFRGLLGDYHKHLIFKAIGNSYANGFALCLNDSSWGGVAFKLEPGTEQGKFHCPPGDKYQGYDSGTYTSKVEKDGDRYTVRIIGNHFGGWSKRGKLERPTYNYPIEYELRFALRDGKCTLEHLSARQGKDAFRSNSQFNVIRSTPESTCGFE